MVRTRADNTARKAVAAKAPRKVLGSSSGGASGSSMMSPSGKQSKYAGGNAVCPRPTPEWQKGISGFLVKSPKDKENESPEEMGESSASAQEPISCSQGSSSAEPSSQTSGSSAAGSSSSVERNGIISDDED